MTKLIKNSLMVGLIMALGAIVGVTFYKVLQTPPPPAEVIVNNVHSAVPTENPPYELLLVAEDLKMYDYVSESVRQLILDSLESANKRFKVPIGLMHAVTRTESEYRFWIDHATVTVTVRGKRVTTNAIGLGGVIWAFWGDTLSYFNVAHNRSDLYLPGVGIMAQACVLHLIINDVMSANTSIPNIVARIQSKYYGAYAREYIARMKLVTSDLWIKRIAREIDYVYNIVEDSLKVHDRIYEGYKHTQKEE